MRFFKKPGKFVTAALVISALVRCGGDRFVGGSGSDVGNGRTEGSLIMKNGEPATQKIVMLVPANYDPAAMSRSDLIIDTTDSAGAYAFASVISGRYNILALQPSTGLRDMIGNVALGDSAVTLPPDTLRIPGAISIYLPDSIDTVAGGYVFIQGTTIYSSVNKSGRVQLDSVPAGTIFPIMYGDRNNALSFRRIADSVTVEPGLTTVVYPSWKWSKKLHLNTTPFGANVAGNVMNFPVLVRLNSGNFDFAKAKSAGEDVRFTKSDGTPLQYEVERWDAAANAAEIWVKVDTVFGDDSSHFIIMYWGNSLATSASNSAAVFDTAIGLQGVWHLNDPVSGQVKDATSNGYNGTPVNVTAQSAVNAMVGVGRRLQGNDSGYIVLQGTADSKLNFQENGIYAISAWVYLDTLDGAVHNIVSKSDQQYNLEDYVNDWEFAEYKSTQQWEMTRSPAAAKTWTHVVGVRNLTKQYLFVNGQCVDSTIDIPIPTSSARNTSYPVMFGKSDGNQSSPGMPFLFHGILDEIRMLSRAPSVDWIKLCYMNQKQQDKLIEFK